MKQMAAKETGKVASGVGENQEDSFINDTTWCVRAQSSPALWGPMDCSLPGFSVHNFPGSNTGVGCHFLL